MRLRDLILPAAAIGAATVLAFPTTARGFEVFGDVLDLTQRDYRIFNNFTDVWANDNLVPDPDFPGSLGAELAIRKGVAEWGSTLHGSGSTDILNPDGIGSGGSNFDAFYSGRSTGPGPMNSNVISQIDGTAAVFAFTELPIGDGWRIRFYEDPKDWNDGPGLDLGGSNPFDIQGVAAHEYGHALGLDHTSVPGSTMFVNSSQLALDFRSIEADDIAGVQFLYGVKSPNKPEITTYELSGNTVSLFGTSFHATDNEVWFTHASPTTGVDGTPVKVLGVRSHHNGTKIEITIPANAGPGDVLVKRRGNAFEDISNAFPFDPQALPYLAPFAYGTPKTTSIGTLPTIEARSLPSATAGSFEIFLEDGVGGGLAVVFSGPGRSDLPYMGGTLLVEGPYRREGMFNMFFGTGNVQVPVDPSFVGSTRYYQLWFQDPNDAFGSGLTNGLRVTIVP